MYEQNNIGIKDFLKYYPLMAIRPASNSSELTLRGTFEFTESFKDKETICDSYQLRIDVPKKFPKVIPSVIETGNKIPRIKDNHVNERDGTLCLGSRIRILLMISREPNLKGFAKNCITPFLYAISYKLQLKKDIPFGELEHGTPGELDDYMDLFGLESHDDVKQAVKLLAMQKKLANKKQCPCGCGKKLGQCKFNVTLSKFRKLTDRKWYENLKL